MEVSDLTGVTNVDADVESKKATITFEAPATEEKIKELLSEINYPVAA
jgi:copper chaperone CopZ